MVTVSGSEKNQTDSDESLLGSPAGSVETLTACEETLTASEDIEAGVFCTTSARAYQHGQSTSGVVHFETINNDTPPALILGLHMIDLNIVRIATRVRSVADNSARIELYTWHNTTHHGSGCNWLRIPADDRGLQWGSFSTTDDHESNRPQEHTVRRITFARPYSSAPHVVVWLNSFDTGPNADCRVAASATDVCADGFTIHLDTWSDSKLWSAGATWLAYPRGRTDLYSGTFSTEDVRPSRPWRNETDGRVAFWRAGFTTPPEVFVALNKLEIARGRNARCEVKGGDVTTTGMDWTIRSWHDTLLHQAGASFLAFGKR